MARILTRSTAVSIMAVVAFSRVVDMAAPGTVHMLREDARVSEAVADRVQVLAKVLGEAVAVRRAAA
jgi:hypothetical protein